MCAPVRQCTASQTLESEWLSPPYFSPPHWFSTRHLLFVATVEDPASQRFGIVERNAVAKGSRWNCQPPWTSSLLGVWQMSSVAVSPLKLEHTLWCPWEFVFWAQGASGHVLGRGPQVCWFEDSPLRTTVLMSQRDHKARIFWAFSHFLWQNLISSKCWKARNTEKYI